MKKKAIQYTIILLVIPLIISIIIAIATSNKEYDNSRIGKNYNAIDIPSYKKSIDEEIKTDNIAIYFGVFTLIILSGGAWFYVKNKKGF